jgi:hypothetical protein
MADNKGDVASPSSTRVLYRSSLAVEACGAPFGGGFFVVLGANSRSAN